MTAKYPDRNIEWVNKGINGDVIQGLLRRWTEDVIDEDRKLAQRLVELRNELRAKKALEKAAYSTNGATGDDISDTEEEEAPPF